MNCLETNEKIKKSQQGNKSHKEKNWREIIELKNTITQKGKRKNKPCWLSIVIEWRLQKTESLNLRTDQ